MKHEEVGESKAFLPGGAPKEMIRASRIGTALSAFGWGWMIAGAHGLVDPTGFLSAKPLTYLGLCLVTIYVMSKDLRQVILG